MDIWVVSTFWLLWIMPLWTFAYKFLCERMFSILLSVYLGVELLGHMVTLYLTFWRVIRLFPTAQECSTSHSHQHDVGSWEIFETRTTVYIHPGVLKNSVQQMDASKGRFKKRKQNIAQKQSNRVLSRNGFLPDRILTHIIMLLLSPREATTLILNSFTYPPTNLKNRLTKGEQHLLGLRGPKDCQTVLVANHLWPL